MGLRYPAKTRRGYRGKAKHNSAALTGSWWSYLGGRAAFDLPAVDLTAVETHTLQTAVGVLGNSESAVGVELDAADGSCCSAHTRNIREGAEPAVDALSVHRFPTFAESVKEASKLLEGTGSGNASVEANDVAVVVLEAGRCALTVTHGFVWACDLGMIRAFALVAGRLIEDVFGADLEGDRTILAEAAGANSRVAVAVKVASVSA